jgi:hypothetical protein
MASQLAILLAAGGAEHSTSDEQLDSIARVKKKVSLTAQMKLRSKVLFFIVLGAHVASVFSARPKLSGTRSPAGMTAGGGAVAAPDCWLLYSDRQQQGLLPHAKLQKTDILHTTSTESHN